jgi:hypothetical protein
VSEIEALSFLRTISTRRLLALVAGLLTMVVGGAAIALAASGGRPVAPPKRLALAIHDALGAPSVKGVTARIKFTNHLIDSASIQGSNPILTGASGRLWARADRLRLELQSDQGDAQLVLDGERFWIYDAGSNTVYRGRIPRESGRGDGSRRKAGGVPSVKRIEQGIARVTQHVSLSGAVPSDVAGRPAYRVRIAPKHDGGLLGSAEFAWDAARGVPLRAAIYARGSSSPVLELRATNIFYGSVPASAFAVSPPAHAKQVDLSPRSLGAAGRHGHESGRQVSGRAAVRRALPFTLAAPSRLAGLQSREVRLIDWGGRRAALLTYGRGLGGIAVIEQKARRGEPALLQVGRPGGGESQNGLNLPQVSIHGASGRELVTALGTVVAFTRDGVDYMVLGSVPAAAARAAARGL